MREPETLVDVRVYTESGCSIDKGEYTVYVTGVMGGMRLDPVQEDDPQLILDCVNDWVYENMASMPKEGEVHLRLRESGERQDVFWVKYFVVDRVWIDDGRLIQLTQD